MRGIDWWINANAVTLLATAVTVIYALEWHESNRRVRVRLSGQLAAMARLNVIVARWVLGINAAVFALGLALIQEARRLDALSTAAHPTRIPGYVVWGTLAFTAIWVSGCLGAWWFRRTMDHIMAMEETRPLRAFGREERTG